MESWADHTAWVSSTDKKGDKKQQMGQVFTKTTLQDTGLLCSNETAVPSCHTLARTLAILWIKERHAWLEKQQANSCRQIHMQKKAQKAKQQHRPSTHTPWGAPGTPPSEPLRRRGGEEEKRGRKLSLGSWHSTWPSASFSAPASQTWLSWWVPRAGSCSFPPGPVLAPLHAPAEPRGSCSWTARMCLKKLKGQLGLLAELNSSGPAAQVALQNSGLKLHLIFSGLQTLFCCKRRTFSPTFLVIRSHTIICKATLPAKCKCCPGHINNLQWWFLTVRIPPLLELVRKDEGPLSQAQMRIET